MIFFKKLFYCYIVVLLMVLFLTSCGSLDMENFAFVRIGGAVISVEVVEDLDDQIKGLSGRDELGESDGMLFVYDEPVETQDFALVETQDFALVETQDFASVLLPSFWMNGMKFPLDIVFIKNNVVVDLVKNLPVPKFGEEPVSYTSKKAANYVLEMNAGFVETHGIEVGDFVDIKR